MPGGGLVLQTQDQSRGVSGGTAILALHALTTKGNQMDRIVTSIIVAFWVLTALLKRLVPLTAFILAIVLPVLAGVRLGEAYHPALFWLSIPVAALLGTAAIVWHSDQVKDIVEKGGRS